MRKTLLIFVNFILIVQVFTVESYQGSPNQSQQDGSYENNYSSDSSSESNGLSDSSENNSYYDANTSYDINSHGNFWDQYKNYFEKKFFATYQPIKRENPIKAQEKCFKAYEAAFENHQQFIQQIYVEYFVSPPVYLEMTTALDKITHKDFVKLKKDLEKKFYIDNHMNNDERNEELDVPFLMQLNLIFNYINFVDSHIRIKYKIEGGDGDEAYNIDEDVAIKLLNDLLNRITQNTNLLRPTDKILTNCIDINRLFSIISNLDQGFKNICLEIKKQSQNPKIKFNWDLENEDLNNEPLDFGNNHKSQTEYDKFWNDVGLINDLLDKCNINYSINRYITHQDWVSIEDQLSFNKLKQLTADDYGLVHEDLEQRRIKIIMLKLILLKFIQWDKEKLYKHNHYVNDEHMNKKNIIHNFHDKVPIELITLLKPYKYEDGRQRLTELYMISCCDQVYPWYAKRGIIIDHLWDLETSFKKIFIKYHGVNPAVFERSSRLIQLFNMLYIKRMNTIMSGMVDLIESNGNYELTAYDFDIKKKEFKLFLSFTTRSSWLLKNLPLEKDLIMTMIFPFIFPEYSMIKNKFIDNPYWKPMVKYLMGYSN